MRLNYCTFLLFIFTANLSVHSQDLRENTLFAKEGSSNNISGLSQGINKDVRFRHLSVEHGLPNNTINALYQDSLGFIWIGTLNGLARYDGYSYTNYYASPNNSNTIPDNTITDILEDSKGDLWIATYEGATRYNRETDAFETIPFEKSIYTFDETEEVQLLETSAGELFLTTNKGQFEVMPGARFLEISDSLPDICHTRICFYDRDKYGNSLIIGSDSLYLILENDIRAAVAINDSVYPLSSVEMTRGDKFVDRIYMVDDLLYGFDTKTVSFKPLALNNYLKGLSIELEIDNIYEDSDHNYWIGTREHGLVFSDNSFETIHVYQTSNDNNSSLSINKTTCFIEDNQHNYWIGTWRGGVNFIDYMSINSFKTILKNVDEQKELNYPTVLSFYALGRDTILYGTGGGGLIIWDRIRDKFTALTHQAEDPASLASISVLDIFEGSHKELWISCYGGLSILEPDRKSIRNYRKDDGSIFNLPSNDIRNVEQDVHGDYWISTLGGGLVRYSPDQGIHLFTTENSDLISDKCLSSYPDSKGNLWIGTYSGISVYNSEKNSFTNYTHNPSDSLSLSNNWVFCFHEDHSGNIWIGTKGGLNIFRPQTGEFDRLTMENGLPSNRICGILEDVRGRVWISTDNGLARYTPSDHKIRIYDKSDGLQGNEFLIGSYYESPEGEFFFGGSNGFSCFFPDKISSNKYIPPAYISMSGRSLQSDAFSEKLHDYNLRGETIILPFHDSRILNFDFVALNYSNPLKNEYAYQLAGLEDNWNYSGQKRDASYTNLEPGHYSFRVRASNEDGFWNEEGATLSFVILPPWWRTWWAFTLYTLITIAVLLLFRRSAVARIRLQSELEMERIEQEKSKELHKLKLRFFTNVSHEFRTPLSLIISPIEELLTIPEFKGKIREQILTIQYNTKRLLLLVNQLLDISKIENGYRALLVAEGDIILQVHHIFSSFNYTAEKRSIEYRFISNTDSYRAWFDADKLEKILFNILSNAFKYTGDTGKIDVSIDIPTDQPKDCYAIIRIKDTGIGISEESQKRIFDNFYQDNQGYAGQSQGSGIGLALVKSLVQVYRGEIHLESEPEKGTEFILKLPVSDDLFLNEEFVKHEQDQLLSVSFEKVPEAPFPETQFQHTNKLPGKELIMIVEDHSELRNYLCRLLEARFQIIQAQNGDEGLIKAFEHVPDLIISDIMMPGLDGLELCARIKADLRTSHIPVILLTAKGMEDHMVEGMETGADSYIIKPFSNNYLIANIDNLLNGRKQLKEAFSRKITLEPKDITITSLDERFLRRAMEIVEEHMEDPDFNVDILCQEIGMSRTNLYKKLVSLTDFVPSGFIRNLRIKRAARLLEEGQLTVSEVIFRIGIKSRSHFIKSFKEVFGISPSQYIKKSRASKEVDAEG